MLMYLNNINKHLHIKDVNDNSFKTYGNILYGYDFSCLVKYMEQKTSIPYKGNIYKASVKEMENYNIFKSIKESLYGDMDIQIGYCNGNNSSLNGLEYHKGSEINVAVTDIVLILGNIRDINNNTYNTKSVEAFYIPKGTAVELYQTTLHFAPCKLSNDGFKCIVILPKGTNTQLEDRKTVITDEDKLLFAKNKWLLVHEDAIHLIEKGAYPGIVGENLEIKY